MPECSCAPIEVSLRRDRSLPRRRRPVFLLRPLTQRQRVRAEALVSHAEPRPDVRAKMLEDAIDFGLVGWRNMTHEGQPVQWGDDVVGGFLTDAEVWELAGLVLAARAPERRRGLLRRLAGAIGRLGRRRRLTDQGRNDAMVNTLSVSTEPRPGHQASEDRRMASPMGVS